MDEDILLESVDDAMQAYLGSDTYHHRRKTINEMGRLFRAGLTPAQKQAFRRLLDAIYEADNEYSKMAYLAGCHNNRNIDSQN